MHRSIYRIERFIYTRTSLLIRRGKRDDLLLEPATFAMFSTRENMILVLRTVGLKTIVCYFFLLLVKLNPKFSGEVVVELIGQGAVQV